MKNKTYRKLATLAASALIAIGGISVAPSATAETGSMPIQPLGTFGGNFSCPAGQTATIWVTSTNGHVYVFGAGLIRHNGQLGAGRWPFPTGARTGAWTVNGAASSASIECLSPVFI
jgi:hypothetical protein